MLVWGARGYRRIIMFGEYLKNDLLFCSAHWSSLLTSTCSLLRPRTVPVVTDLRDIWQSFSSGTCTSLIVEYRAVHRSPLLLNLPAFYSPILWKSSFPFCSKGKFITFPNSEISDNLLPYSHMTLDSLQRVWK